MKRRGFFGALLAMPAVVKAAKTEPAPVVVEPVKTETASMGPFDFGPATCYTSISIYPGSVIRGGDVVPWRGK